MDTLQHQIAEMRQPAIPAAPQTKPVSAMPETAATPPSGPAGAAILSAGIGCFGLGVFAVAGDGWPAIARFFTFYLPTGPLSGVTTSAIILWLVAWLGLARAWRGKPVAMAKINIAAFLLLALGVLLTFPPFGDLVLGK